MSSVSGLRISGSQSGSKVVAKKGEPFITNAGNTINAINSKAVSVIRYGAGIIKWRKDELTSIDGKTRKMMTKYKALHPKVDVDRLYMKRSEGGRGMISVEDCVEMEINSMYQYILRSNEKLLKIVKEEEIVKGGTTKKDIAKNRENSYTLLHGQFVRNTEQLRDELSWN